MKQMHLPENCYSKRNMETVYGDGSVPRIEADNKLFKCILNKAHNPISWVYYVAFASVYWLGVRVLGGSSYNNE